MRRVLWSPRTWALCLGLAATAFFLSTHWLAVFNEAINWDEFALLERADRTVRLGVVDGGGRPGLVTLLLVPFVRNCVDSVAAVVEARQVWQALVIVYLVGVYAVVRRWTCYARDKVESRGEGILAVALLAFLPAFVMWSVQVRTDQVALAAGIWASVLLLAQRTSAAIAAGVLFAVAVLSTQKALYMIAFAALLFLTATVSRAVSEPNAWRKEFFTAATRIALLAAGAAVVVGGYYLLVPSVADLVSKQALVSSAATMDWYRERLGFRIYTVNAERLWVHCFLLLALVWWTWTSIRGRDHDAAPRLLTCWAMLGLGILVIVVHGSRFPYFLMTAGLFPAVALALAAGQVLARMGPRGNLLIAAFVVVLAATSAPEALEAARGTQERQRKTMELIEETPLREMRGYQVEGALFCTKDPEPLPVWFTQQIKRRRMEHGPHAFDSLIAEFRKRPVAYMVESFRMRQFSLGIRGFWEEHYVPYAASLYVAGFRISGEGLDSNHAVIVSGMYQWFPDDRRRGAAIAVDGRPLAPEESIYLDAGPHVVSRVEGATEGVLVLALGHTRPGEIFPFYDERQWDRLRGYM